MTGVAARIIEGDCVQVMPDCGPFDLIVADPPYGDTSLAWDKAQHDWVQVAAACLKATGSLWLFGSMRSIRALGTALEDAGLRQAQDIVWEKHNGSSFHADRFKRVHEHAVQFYRTDTKWQDVWNDPQKTNDATARTVRRKKRPPHTGHIEAAEYVSHDGGPRLMRSVIFVRSVHGSAIHPTEKPVELLEILVRTSCPPGGLVGDFFAGSGAVGDACLLSGRNYVGCEIDPDYASRAQRRLQAFPMVAS